MQLELKRLQRDVGITFVLATHDQEEALTHGRPFAAGAPALLTVWPERLELAATEPPPERIGLPVTCSDVVFQGALLRYALRDADGGDFVAYLEASRHDPNAATNAATPNVAKDARRRQLERAQSL